MINTMNATAGLKTSRQSIDSEGNLPDQTPRGGSPPGRRPAAEAASEQGLQERLWALARNLWWPSPQQDDDATAS